jgi:hypothetical protein
MWMGIYRYEGVNRMSARVIQVIEVVQNRGTGVLGDPVRYIKQYWSFDGELLAENDPVIVQQMVDEYLYEMSVGISGPPEEDD